MKAKTSDVVWMFSMVATFLVAATAKAQSNETSLSPSDVTFYARLLELSDKRQFDSAFLMEGAYSTSTPIRWAASLTLAQLAVTYREEALPLLRDLGGKRDTALAANAIFGLGLAKDSLSIAILASWTGRETSIGRAAAWALGEIGAPALPTIVSLLNERKNPSVLSELLYAIAKIQPLPLEAVLPHLKSRYPAVLGAAVYAIARQGLPAGVRPVMNVSQQDPFVRSQIARALRKSAAGDSLQDEALAMLSQFSRDGYIAVRVSAIYSLASYGYDAEDPVLQATTDREPNVRIAAAQALGYVLPPNRMSWNRLWDGDTTFAFRTALVESSVRAGAPMEVLNSWRTHSNWRYRAAFVRAWGADDDILHARTVALIATYDPESRVRTAAYEVLSSSDPYREDDVIQRVLDRGLNDPDPVAREAIPWFNRIPSAQDSINAERSLDWYENVVREVVVRTLEGPSQGAVMETDRGTIKLSLMGLQAPLTVYNFMQLARRGFYNVTRFHRVVPNFVAQDGDPRGDGNGGPGYSVRDEFNREIYVRGTVGMATAGPDTGGSQYFLTLSPQPHLDGHYTVFARVVTGMAVMDALVQGDMVKSISIP